MDWYWWILLWLVMGALALAFIAGAHDDRFDERPLGSLHPPNGDKGKSKSKSKDKNDEPKWW